MKNIHVLPTDKPSRLYHWKGNSTYNSQFRLRPIAGFCDFNQNDAVNQNIYITNDEEIKDGYYLDLTHNIIMKSVFYPSSDKNCKKIILTTDQDLIKDGVQTIDDEFLKWFVKNPSCEYVKTEKFYSMSQSTYSGIEYEIIIPKEEPKFENSIENSINVMSIANSMFGKKEEPKQETLEEAAERIANNFEEPNFKAGVVYGVIEGAKWQAERIYNEEEVEDLIYKVCGTVARLQGITLNGNNINTAYKQFKKK